MSCGAPSHSFEKFARMIKKTSPLVVGVEALALTPADRARLKWAAGVILFSRNYESPAQLKKLTLEIKKEHPELMIMVDQEGGRVMRFRDGFSEIPPAKFFGDLADSKGMEMASQEAEKYGALMASELLALGVDLSLSPVVDLGINQEIIGSRAFHSDPEKVIVLAKAWITGMNKVGMSAVLKHFPGHGSVKGDTHVSYLMDKRDLKTIEKTDLAPFKKLISRDNFSGVAGVMASHVVYSEVDDRPASFSSYWLKKILRESLGFQGIIFSDDLGMQAAKLSEHSSENIGAPIKLALSAGCDAVLLCNEFDLINRLINNIESSGNFSAWLSEPINA